MLWRHLSWVRAWSAAGLMTCSLSAALMAAEPGEPTPSDDAAVTVSVLDARKAGDIKIDARGAGQDRVKLTLRNTTTKRLKVVLPPGLVASSVASQGRGGGGGFQSMGLGSVSNRPGTFGAFQGADNSSDSAFRSVSVSKADAADAITVPAGSAIDLTMTSVCLNYGVRTPGARDSFDLVDVEDYTSDPRARKALRSVATYGTSQGVAQAIMWRVSNNVPFEVIAQEPSKAVNAHELAIAARFVDALDASGDSDLVDPSYLREGRVFVRINGEGVLASEASRLSRELEGLRVLGLPVRVIDGQNSAVNTPAVLLNVVLTGSQAGETRGRVVISEAVADGDWSPLAKAGFTEGSAASVIDGAGLARALDRAVASACVSVKVAKKTSSQTTFKVQNRLPFTLSGLTLKAGNSSGAPTVPFRGVGIAPGRTAVLPVQSPVAEIDLIQFNGL